jgi:hypothetical protein
MLTKTVKKLTPLLLSFIPLSILIIYLSVNNMLNENSLLVISLAFIVNFMTALIILFNVVNLIKYWMSSNNLKDFIQLILWTISALIVEYLTTIPQTRLAITMANGIITIYIFTLIHQYFKQGERK